MHTGIFCAEGAGDAEMVWQYVLLLVVVVLGIIAGGLIGCETTGDWLWMVAVGALVFLGGAVLLAVLSPRVPGHVSFRSSGARRAVALARGTPARWPATWRRDAVRRARQIVRSGDRRCLDDK